MTPEERMDLMTRIVHYDESRSPRAGMTYMQEILEFIERLEQEKWNLGYYDGHLDGYRDGYADGVNETLMEYSDPIDMDEG